MKNKTLYLLDGTALAYRAFFAMSKNPLTNSRGENTSALFGVLNTVIKIISENNPNYIAVMFDSSAPTFRHKIFGEYKSTRAKMPQELADGLPPIKDALSALGIPIVEEAGIEADDAIAALARKAERDGFDVVIITGDKDLMQLIDEHISIITPSRGRQIPERHWNIENAQERMGVKPTQVADYLSLVGDTSDNISGVKGIGKKSAVALLARYSTLDEIYEHLDDLSPSIKRKLEAGRESAYLSRSLILLRDDPDSLPIVIDDLVRQPLDKEKLREILVRYELFSLMKRLFSLSGGAETGAGEKETASQYATPNNNTDEISHRHKSLSIARNSADVDSFFQEIDNGIIAIEPFWDGTKPFEGLLVGLAFLTENSGIYIPLAHRKEGELLADDTANIPLDKVANTLAEGLQKASFVIAYDVKGLFHLMQKALAFSFSKEKMGDVMVGAYLIEPSIHQHSLSSIAEKYLSESVPEVKDILGSGRSARMAVECSPDDAALYCEKRVCAAYKLWDIIHNRLIEDELYELYDKLECPLIFVLAKMEQAGVYVDRNTLKRLSEQFSTEADQIRQKAFDIAGEKFNLDSPIQLREVLFDRLGLPPQRKTKTGYSTDTEVLEKLAPMHPLPALIIHYRQMKKLLTTYTDALPRYVNPSTGRIHSIFNQAVAATGRLSSSEPNLQNIPIRGEQGKLIREAFTAQQNGWVLLSADYSQIELRILAHISGDKALIDAFRSGEDIHRRTAALVLGKSPDDVGSADRRIAKMVNYGIAYGLSAYGLAQRLGIAQSDARLFIESYFATYEGVKRYMDSIIEQAKRDGYVSTLLGRRRYLPDINSKNAQRREFAKRTAINTPIQGTAADLIKRAMIKLSEWLNANCSEAMLVLQIHDELLVELPEDDVSTVSNAMKEIMEGAIELSVPLAVDISYGKSWAEAH